VPNGAIRPFDRHGDSGGDRGGPFWQASPTRRERRFRSEVANLCGSCGDGDRRRDGGATHWIVPIARYERVAFEGIAASNVRQRERDEECGQHPNAGLWFDTVHWVNRYRAAEDKFLSHTITEEHLNGQADSI
jgi:hypothetical protein